MTPQQESDLTAMTILYGRLDQHRGPIKETALKNMIAVNERVSPGRTELSLGALADAGMIEIGATASGDKTITISRRGVEWLEQHYNLSREGDVYELDAKRGWIALPLPTASGQSPSRKPASTSVDWAKWGAIAAIVAIPVTILLWYLS